MKHALTLLTALLIASLAAVHGAPPTTANLFDASALVPPPHEETFPATKRDDTYEAAIPAEAAQWFILVSDDRPMSVSSDMITVSAK